MAMRVEVDETAVVKLARQKTKESTLMMTNRGA